MSFVSRKRWPLETKTAAVSGFHHKLAHAKSSGAIQGPSWAILGGLSESTDRSKTLKDPPTGGTKKDPELHHLILHELAFGGNTIFVMDVSCSHQNYLMQNQVVQFMALLGRSWEVFQGLQTAQRL